MRYTRAALFLSYGRVYTRQLSIPALGENGRAESLLWLSLLCHTANISDCGEDGESICDDRAVVYIYAVKFASTVNAAAAAEPLFSPVLLIKGLISCFRLAAD